MNEVSIIGLDLAKNVIQAHGADARGAVIFRRKLRRHQVVQFLAGFKPCVVAMEACAGAHYWARCAEELGHTPRLLAAQYVKPFVKRQKNDAADAEAICEAATRPTMRFVRPKSAEQQAATTAFRARDLFVMQRTQLTNALRGHFAEYGEIFPAGLVHLPQILKALSESPTLPQPAREAMLMLSDQINQLNEKIDSLDREIAARAKRSEVARRLMTIPGLGPITATAIEALAPPAETFNSGREFAAWLGLAPKQQSSGGKEKLGKISKMGERTLRRLLTLCASSVVRWAVRGKGSPSAWLKQMLARKPRMLVTIALANKMARIIWALMLRGGSFRSQIAAAHAA